MDLITGKAQREVFFDPSICSNLDKAEEDWLVESLYHPVPVTQTIDGEVVIAAGEGDFEVLLRLKAQDAVEVKAEHKEGTSLYPHSRIPSLALFLVSNVSVTFC